MLAVFDGNEEMVDLLLNAGAPVETTSCQWLASDPGKTYADAPDEYKSTNNTVVLAACGSRHNSVLSRLLVAGANSNTRNSNQKSALNLSITRRDQDCVRKLIEAGATYEMPELARDKLLSQSKDNDLAEVMKRLVVKDLDLYTHVLIGVQSLDMAASRGDSKTVDTLLECGFDPSPRTN